MSKQANRILSWILLSIMTTTILFLACDKKNPTEPEPTPQQPDSGYAAYFAKGGGKELYTYYPKNSTLDTFKLGFNVRHNPKSMSISPDGSQLYIRTDNSVMLLDTDSKNASLFWSKPAYVSLSPDGKYALLQDSLLTIIDIATRSVVYSDTIDITLPEFSNDSKVIYGLSTAWARGKSKVRQLFIDSAFKSTITEVNGIEADLVLFSKNRNRWYFYSTGGFCSARFLAYDVASKSFIFEDSFDPGSGWMTESPDGRFVVYTNPGQVIGWCNSPTYNLMIYDVENNSLLKRMKLENKFRDYTSSFPLPVEQTVFTPDGKWLLGTAQLPFFVLINVQTWEVQEYGDVGCEQVLMSPVCQSEL